MKITNKSANTNSCTGTMGKRENRGGKCCIEKMVSEYSLQNREKKRKKQKDTDRDGAIKWARARDSVAANVE